MDALAHEDEGIERAAIAVCWMTRPPLMDRQISDIQWWNAQTEQQRRIWLTRMRIGIEVWERHMEAEEMAHAAE